MYQTFLEQLAKLPQRARHNFIETWGEAPWTNPEFNHPDRRTAWKRELDPMPVFPRWEFDTYPSSPLWMALRAKNRRAASALLDKTPALSREEAGRCALLTLQWAPDLLERILDRTEKRPFLWMRHLITLPSGSVLRVQGSLLMLSAALDDLPALELLLRRGDPVDYNFDRDRWTLISDMLMGGVAVRAEHGPVYSLQRMEHGRPTQDDSSGTLLQADPLSAAIFCNASRCALRLLQEPQTKITPAVRRALAITPENPTQSLVAAQLDTPLDKLLQPEDFGPELDHPLFLTVLKQNPEISRRQVRSIISYYRPDPNVPLRPEHFQILSCIDPILLGDVIWEFCLNHRPREDLLNMAQQLGLPLNRCRIPEQARSPLLNYALEYFQICGTPPEGGLSGAAAALLNLLDPDSYSYSNTSRVRTPEQLIRLPQALSILQTEDPAFVMSYLEHNPNISADSALPLMNLLHIRKEVSYDL